MEYCELGDLSHFIKKRDRLDTFPVTQELARKYPSQGLNAGLHEVVIRHFLKQLASALEFLRSKNYVHRDVKPQNLLLLPPKASRGGSASRILEGSQGSLIPVAGVASLPMLKLADFGFARVLPSTSLADTLCGSPLYMAPEILRYERYDAKADLWSVGTVLYEMAAARPPFRARNHVELLRKIEAAEDVIKYPREVTVSPEMKALTRALLKRSPVERLTFENFFSHPVVTGEIPGLVEDDVPRPTRPIPEPDFDIESHAQRDSKPPSRAGSLRSRGYESPRESGSGSPRDQVGRTPPTGSPRPSAEATILLGRAVLLVMLRMAWESDDLCHNIPLRHPIILGCQTSRHVPPLTSLAKPRRNEARVRACNRPWKMTTLPKMSCSSVITLL